MPTPYVRTLEDELDWTLLDQLHRVVLQLSDTCYKIKQIFVTAEVAVATLLIKFTDGEVDTSFFVASITIALLFWFIDGVTYFYQVKIRGTMNRITERIRKRQPNTGGIFVAGGKQDLLTISPERIAASKWQQIRNSFFNHSMWLYGILVAISIVLWISFWFGTFGS